MIDHSFELAKIHQQELLRTAEHVRMLKGGNVQTFILRISSSHESGGAHTDAGVERRLEYVSSECFPCLPSYPVEHGLRQELANRYSTTTDKQFARRLERGTECVHPCEYSPRSPALDLDCSKGPTCLHNEINFVVALSPVEYLACAATLCIG